MQLPIVNGMDQPASGFRNGGAPLIHRPGTHYL
jgi:hypothetical protein